VTPTTVSNVKKIVAESRFHDDTLCQLLDAARLNLIGGEAKKALNRAARARVVELKDLKAQKTTHEAPEEGHLKRHKRKGSREKHGRKSESRLSEHGDVSQSKPPPWVKDVGLSRTRRCKHRLTSRSCPVSKRSMLDSRSLRSRNTTKGSLSNMARKLLLNKK
jgi:hypothetical protein